MFCTCYSAVSTGLSLRLTTGDLKIVIRPPMFKPLPYSATSSDTVFQIDLLQTSFAFLALNRSPQLYTLGNAPQNLAELSALPAS